MVLSVPLRLRVSVLIEYCRTTPTLASAVANWRPVRRELARTCIAAALYRAACDRMQPNYYAASCAPCPLVSLSPYLSFPSRRQLPRPHAPPHASHPRHVRQLLASIHPPQPPPAA